MAYLRKPSVHVDQSSRDAHQSGGSAEWRSRFADFDSFRAWEAFRSSDDLVLSKTYCDVAGGLIPGLFLSCLMHWWMSSRPLTIDGDGRYWLARADDDWYAEIRLGKEEVVSARRILEARNLITVREVIGDAVRLISLNMSDFLIALDANTGISAEVRNAGPVHNAARSGTQCPGSRSRHPGGNTKKSEPTTWKASSGTSGTELTAAYEVKSLPSIPWSAPHQDEAPAPKYQPGAVWKNRTTGAEATVFRRDGPEVYVLGSAEGISLFALIRQYVYCGQTDGVRLVE